MKVETKGVFPIAIEAEGTVMDYVDDEFVFVIKDEAWTPFEIKALTRNEVEIDLACKYDITIFLITVLDAIDTSDFIFNIHDNEYPDSILTQKNVECAIFLIDQDNIVQAQRHITLSKEASKAICDVLSKVKNTVYFEAEYNCNLEGIQSTWEPFELQEFALVKETFK